MCSIGRPEEWSYDIAGSITSLYELGPQLVEVAEACRISARFGRTRANFDRTRINLVESGLGRPKPGRIWDHLDLIQPSCL